MVQGQCRGGHAEETGGGVRVTERRGRIDLLAGSHDQVRFSGRAVEQCQDAVTVAACGGQSFQHKDDGGVRGTALEPEPGQRGLVHRLRGQVHGTDDRRVRLPRPDRPGAELEGHRAGRLFRRHREARAGEVELGVEPVGDDVRHRPDHPGRGQRRGERVGFGPPPRAVPRDLGVAAHSHQRHRAI